VNERPRLVAIVGAGRNGSTLISRLLDGAGTTWVHPVELNYLNAWDDLARIGHVRGLTMLNATTLPLTALDRELPVTTLLDVYGWHWDEIRDVYAARLSTPVDRSFEPRTELARRDHWSPRGFLPAFLSTTARAYGVDAELLVFKTIETPFVSDYARLFPEMQFIHILRSPVDNYASLKRTVLEGKGQPFYWGGHDILRTLIDVRWLPHARAILSGLMGDPDRHRLVRYEDLVADPVATIAALCDWLGVSTPMEPDRQTVFAGRAFGELPANPSKSGLLAPERVVFDMASTYGYENVVGERERLLIERLTGPLARELGYEIAPPTRSRFSLWLTWLRPDQWERSGRRSRARWLFEMVKRRAYVTRRLALP
jgi:hypothetical protein